MSLRFAEEILLLALDDSSGKLHPLPDRALDLALVGALLMELAFAGKIDTDEKELAVLDREPTGDDLLDLVLGAMPKDRDRLPIQNALSAGLRNIGEVRKKLFEGLIAKGILKQEKCRFLWVMPERRYPVIDGSQEAEVKSRIREVILSGAIPDPKDVVIICLMKACDLSPYVFTEQELEKARPRIAEVAKMDFIGQALARAIQHIQAAILETIAYIGM
ncbi:GPP34 family phosphoprotein [Ruficoccus amylovorans]|uniref:GPP34 family phosphoprotein n=1 Tax=Ruficoccus amylovorans TaxID=1804625 RepID=A0A842HG85_9BACT|nr:GPP34 family phosphoprotein [Ruficoccus amylovorans]MBC2595695.1 GPP34 family phosphoprotein [Ruficoccus amylovorans]